jgi:hypothetical protein
LTVGGATSMSIAAPPNVATVQREPMGGLQ